MKTSPWRQLLDTDLIREPTEEEVKFLRRLDADLSFTDWLCQIGKTHPSLLTHAGIVFLAEGREFQQKSDAEYRDEKDRDNRVGKYAPQIVVDELYPQVPGKKGSATDAQKKYLRDLGVTGQDALLNRITRAEASQLIDDVLKLRGDS
jgi:hypothetical protein